VALWSRESPDPYEALAAANHWILGTVADLGADRPTGFGCAIKFDSTSAPAWLRHC